MLLQTSETIAIYGLFASPQKDENAHQSIVEVSELPIATRLRARRSQSKDCRFKN